MWNFTLLLSIVAATSATPLLSASVPDLRFPNEEALRRYVAGRALEEEGLVEGALSEYFRALVFDDSSSALARRVAEAALLKGDLPRAFEFADRALARDSSDARAHWLRGTVLLHQGKERDAILSLAAAVARDSDRVEYVRTLGRAADRLERWNIARRAFRRVTWLDPDDPEPWFELAAVEARLGHFGAADTAASEAADLNRLRPGLSFLRGWIAENLRRDADAVMHYRDHLLANTGDVAGRRQIAFALRRLKRPREALVEARTLARARPDDLEAQALHVETAFEAQQPSEAVRVLDRLSKQRESSREIRVLRVDMLGRHGRAAQAIKEAEAWLAAGPDDIPNRALAARASELGGDWTGAIAHLQHAVELAPDSLAPRALLARLLQHRNRWSEAEAEWRAANQRFPEHVGVLYEIAVCREHTGDLIGAESAARDALKREPDNPELLNFLGYLFADHAFKLDEAVLLVRRALSADPDNGAYLDSLGWAYFRLGRFDEARRLLERAVERTGGDAVVHEHLGDVYNSLRLNNLAVEQYRRSAAAGNRDPGLRAKLGTVR